MPITLISLMFQIKKPNFTNWFKLENPFRGFCISSVSAIQRIQALEVQHCVYLMQMAVNPGALVTRFSRCDSSVHSLNLRSEIRQLRKTKGFEILKPSKGKCCNEPIICLCTMWTKGLEKCILCCNKDYTLRGGGQKFTVSTAMIRCISNYIYSANVKLQIN